MRFEGQYVHIDRLHPPPPRALAMIWVLVDMLMPKLGGMTLPSSSAGPCPDLSSPSTASPGCGSYATAHEGSWISRGSLGAV